MFGFGSKRQETAPQQAYGPQHLTIDLTGHGQTYDDVTNPAAVQQAVSAGRLEPFPLIGEDFGGELGAGNLLYGPPGVAAAKRHLDDEIVAAIESGTQVGLDADVDYAGTESMVPRRVTFDLGPLGTRELVLW